MSVEKEEFTETFKVLVNGEEQYSFWPSFRSDIPLGWMDTGFEGTKESCCEYVKKVWVDMRPLSLRRQAGDGQVG